MCAAASFLGIDYSLDATGLRCPEPLLRLVDGLRAARPGQVIELRSTDRRAAEFIRPWVARAGHELLSVTPDYGSVTRFVVRKAGGR